MAERYQGTITSWKDDKGFGFVTPTGGGPKVFVHINSFANRQRRPVENELVTYELASDARGRTKGVSVAFAGERPFSSRTSAPGPGVGASTFAAGFLAFVMWAAADGRLPVAVLFAYLVASFVAYLTYLVDKSASLNGRWRIPENTLHLFSLMGGWPGAMLAQRTLRHKTQKKSFQAAFWATVVLNCAGLGWLLSPGGMRTLRTFLGNL